MAWSACVFVIVFLYECSGKIILSNNTNKTMRPRSINDELPPAFWDWRDHNMVSPGKNLMGCNSCFAFVPEVLTDAIDCNVKSYNKTEVSLSQQFRLDCMEVQLPTSCIGKTFGVIVTESGAVLPYNASRHYMKVKMDCLWTGRPILKPIVSLLQIDCDEDEMVELIYRFGSLTAAINSASMMKYTHGIDQPTIEQCPPKELNHVVLIVGYNMYVSEDGKEVVPYWIIQNTWGEEWGEKGFYYLERGRNACGIASDVSLLFVR